MSSPPPATSDDFSGTISPTTSPKPWPDFLDTNSLSLPVSLSDATSRLHRNLTYFRINYIVITCVIVLLSLIFHPTAVILFAVVYAAWYFLYFNRASPDEIAGYEIDEKIVVGFLGVLTVVALFFAHVWGNFLISIAISAGLFCLHGVLRVPTFGDDDPYGGLLDSSAGAYSEF